MLKKLSKVIKAKLLHFLIYIIDTYMIKEKHIIKHPKVE